MRESREFTISDGTRCRAGSSATPSVTGPTPLLLDVHGGPHNAWNGAADEMHLYHQELAARGWTVLIVNPRGSDGYGEEFYNAVFGAWGMADAKDFLEPIDQLVAEGLVDPERLAVTGYSYGGFMTCYLTGHDDRFAAAVAGGVVTDLISMGGTSDDAHCMNALELGAMPWERPRAPRRDVAATRTSTRSRTPTLVLHGADDVRCPVGQAEQWHSALRERGVPTRWCSTRAPATCSRSSARRRTARLQPPRRRLGRAVRRAAAAAPARSTPRTGSAGSRRSPKRHKVPGAQLGILRFAPDATTSSSTAASGTLNKHIDRRPVDRRTRSSRSARSPRSGRRRSSCSSSTRACSPSTPRSSRCCPSCGSPTTTSPSSVTIRHLLTHTSGIDGDVFTDTGRGDDCLEKYVELLAEAGAEPPARRDLVLLQLRVLAARPGDREAHRQDLGRRRCATGCSRRSG